MSIKRLKEDEFLARVIYLWEQFHTRPEMQGITFEEFKKECFEEFNKQNKLNDKELEIYRKNNYNNIIKETDKLLTKDEKKKLEEQDKQMVSQQEIDLMGKR